MKTKITIKKGREGQSINGMPRSTITIDEGREGQQFCDCLEICECDLFGCFCEYECLCRDGQSVEPEREEQREGLTHTKPRHMKPRHMKSVGRVKASPT